MKNVKILKITLLAAIVTAMVVIDSCKCEKEAMEDCWTCSANIDNSQLISSEICSDEQEEDFKREYAGATVNCNR